MRAHYSGEGVNISAMRAHYSGEGVNISAMRAHYSGEGVNISATTVERGSIYQPCVLTTVERGAIYQPLQWSLSGCLTPAYNSAPIQELDAVSFISLTPPRTLTASTVSTNREELIWKYKATSSGNSGFSTDCIRRNSL